jgi:hypothetical protein
MLQERKTLPGWIANNLDDFQVGNEMVGNGIKRCQMITYMVTLAAVTPIGMIIGIILTIHVDTQSGMTSYVFFFQFKRVKKLEYDTTMYAE